MKAADSLLPFVKINAKQKNMTLRALAIASGRGSSIGHFHEVLSGKRNIDLELLKQLADFLDIPLLSLYEAAGLLKTPKNDWFDHLNMAIFDDDMKKLIAALAELPEAERKERVWRILAALGS